MKQKPSIQTSALQKHPKSLNLGQTEPTRGAKSSISKLIVARAYFSNHSEDQRKNPIGFGKLEFLATLSRIRFLGISSRENLVDNVRCELCNTTATITWSRNGEAPAEKKKT